MRDDAKKCGAFETWLGFVESFPITPLWRWSPKAEDRWSRSLAFAGIAHCFDAYGNVLLGASSVEQWYGNVRSVPFLLQAHLDHPGAAVVSTLARSETGVRYAALLQGGLAGDCAGREFSLFDADGRSCGFAVIDKAYSGHNETFLSFRADAFCGDPAYLRPPSEKEPAVSPEVLSGWGLDDHVGCAAILALFSSGKYPDLMGVLTLDEETGGYGLRHIVHAGKRFGIGTADLPLLISLEVTPEYPESGFKSGSGPRWRSRDGAAMMDAAFTNKASELTNIPVVALKKGICEAGLWSGFGGRSACLTIASPHYHNATRWDEWRPETVSRNDTDTLCDALTRVVENERICSGRDLPGRPSPRPSASLYRIRDHVTPLSESARMSPDYPSCLKTVLPSWNALHHEYGLPAVTIAATEWEAVRVRFLTAEFTRNAVLEKLPEAVSSVIRWGGFTETDMAEIPVHLFFGANFNASNTRYGIALSLEKLDPRDLERILVHEITHRVFRDALARLNVRAPLKTFLNEGLACRATIEILGLPLHRAVALPEAVCRDYASLEGELRETMFRWIDGSLLDIRRGRHETLRALPVPHPFRIPSDGGGRTKYGYYLAGLFMRQVREHFPGTFLEWLESRSGREIEDQITVFLKETPWRSKS